MRPRSPPSLPATVIAYTVQFGLAALIVLAPGAAGPPPFVGYGVAIVALPLAVRVVCHRAVTPLQRVWISAALGLHAVGATYGLYANWWYDHLTHTVSGALVAAVAYAVVIASGRVLPGRVSTRTLHAAALACLVGVGLAWEVYELYVPHLVVYGAEDTAKDLLFNVVGWSLVAAGRRRLLAHVPDGLTARLVAHVGHTRPFPDGTT